MWNMRESSHFLWLQMLCLLPIVRVWAYQDCSRHEVQVHVRSSTHHDLSRGVPVCWVCVVELYIWESHKINVRTREMSCRDSNPSWYPCSSSPPPHHYSMISVQTHPTYIDLSKHHSVMLCMNRTINISRRADTSNRILRNPCQIRLHLVCCCSTMRRF